MSAPISEISELADRRSAASIAALQRYERADEPEAVFLADMLARIESARARSRREGFARASRGTGPDGPLRVLLLSYAGAGNTGADLRTIETIRQLHHLFAPRRLELELFVLGGLLDHPVLASVRKMPLHAPYIPDALDYAMPAYDLVINVEGSTYTSKFSDALAGILIGGVALAVAHGSRAFAYGVDSGKMTGALTRFAQQSADGVDILCRNDAAGRDLAALGIAARPGADCAWTYAPSRTACVAGLGEKVVALCPTNPFWWPVTARAAPTAADSAEDIGTPPRYAGAYFHTWDRERAYAYREYVMRFARIAVQLRARGFSPVLVAMEQLDRPACADIAAQLDFQPPIVARGVAALEDVAGVVAHARCVVTTRYHAAVLALSRGVPVFGLTLDERVERLLTEAGLDGWYAACTDADGDEKALARLFDDRQDWPALRAHCLAFANGERGRFAQMGAELAAAMAR
ncbi:MAG TPA: polysaccharide pyruvyl transferase family protein [Trinickia sp.]|uniref:polysaccharide pyruvyl transferase family protein n=1 Tax=Trinickia sp. TaxID=2571163 RepID=UPI002D08662E|nr:polysaccharide pyruvyl transferase family protein [Trinickia sp.]HVW50626.1 polysaccharide pyruvyl transferase family protein [Trinickia sp.]